MSTLAITPASGAITAARTVCRVDVSGAAPNTNTGYNAANYPASPEERYYLDFVLGGVVQGRSYVFTPNGGSHQFNNYIFPTAGSWTINLVRVRDTGTDSTLAVTVA